MAAITSVDNVMETRMETNTSKEGGEEEEPMEQGTGNTQHGQNSGGAPPGYWKEGKNRKDPEIGSEEGGNSSRHGCLSSCRKWCNKLCQFFDCFKYSIVPAESQEDMELGGPQPNQNPLKSPDQERPSHSAAYDQPTQQFYQPRFRLPDRPSWWSTQDTRRYREGYRDILSDDETKKDNYRFYTNQIACRPNHLKIDDFHKKMWGDYNELEWNHSYIQWLFPIREQGMNRQAQELQLHEIDKIQAEESAIARLLLSYELMLDFYGIQVNEEGELERSVNWEGRFENLNHSSHNYLRITRILKCLGEFGFEKLKVPFIRFMLREAIVTGRLRNTLNSCMQYWVEVLRDDGEREEMWRLAQQWVDEVNEGQHQTHQSEKRRGWRSQFHTSPVPTRPRGLAAIILGKQNRGKLEAQGQQTGTHQAERQIESETRKEMETEEKAAHDVRYPGNKNDNKEEIQQDGVETSGGGNCETMEQKKEDCEEEKGNGKQELQNSSSEGMDKTKEKRGEDEGSEERQRMEEDKEPSSEEWGDSGKKNEVKTGTEHNGASAKGSPGSGLATKRGAPVVSQPRGQYNNQPREHKTQCHETDSFRVKQDSKKSVVLGESSGGNREGVVGEGFSAVTGEEPHDAITQDKNRQSKDTTGQGAAKGGRGEKKEERDAHEKGSNEHNTETESPTQPPGSMPSADSGSTAEKRREDEGSEERQQQEEDNGEEGENDTKTAGVEVGTEAVTTEHNSNDDKRVEEGVDEKEKKEVAKVSQKCHGEVKEEGVETQSPGDDGKTEGGTGEEKSGGEGEEEEEVTIGRGSGEEGIGGGGAGSGKGGVTEGGGGGGIEEVSNTPHEKNSGSGEDP